MLKYKSFLTLDYCTQVSLGVVADFQNGEHLQAQKNDDIFHIIDQFQENPLFNWKRT